MKNIGGGTNGRANSSSSINHTTNRLCVSLYFSLSLSSRMSDISSMAHNSASKLTNLLAINIDYENIYIKHKYFEYILKFFTSKMLTASHLIVVWSGKKKWAWGIARVFCCCYSLLLLLPVAGVVISHLVIDRLIIINENGVSRQQQQQNDIYFYALCVADNIIQQSSEHIFEWRLPTNNNKIPWLLHMDFCCCCCFGIAYYFWIFHVRLNGWTAERLCVFIHCSSYE